MCGIVAAYSYRAEGRRVDADELLKMRDAMVPRGPDGEGLWMAEDGAWVWRIAAWSSWI